VTFLLGVLFDPFLVFFLRGHGRSLAPGDPRGSRRVQQKRRAVNLFNDCGQSVAIPSTCPVSEFHRRYRRTGD
jgi:hypothetical protein